MRSPAVVVGLVLGEDLPWMAFAEDQHPAGDSVRAVRTNRSAQAFARGLRGGILITSMPAPARTAPDNARNCPARSHTRNRKSAARSPRSIRRVRICGPVHGRCARSFPGTTPISAAMTARPAQPSRGRGRSAAQPGDLVPQHQQFRVLRRGRVAGQDQPAAELNEDQVEQAKGHRRSSCPTADLGASPQLTGPADFWHPQPGAVGIAAPSLAASPSAQAANWSR